MNDVLDLTELLLEEPAPAPERVRPILELLQMAPPESGGALRTFRNEISRAQLAFRLAHPLGLQQEELRFDLDIDGDIHDLCAARAVHRSESQPRRPSKRDGKFDLAFYRAWFKEKAHNESFYRFGRWLSLGEIACLKHHGESYSQLMQDFREHPLLSFVHLIEKSAFHWRTVGWDESAKLSWSQVVAFHRVLTNFSFGVEGFDVTVDRIKFENPRGSAHFRRFEQPTDADFPEREICLFFDAPLALIISRGGEHLMTIAFAATHAGLLVNQIQLRRKKGNRWLYKLPKPYFSHVLDRLYDACSDAGLKLYLPTGGSLKAAVQDAYGEKKKLDKAAGERIIATYNQRLDGLVRSRTTLKCNDIAYHQITRKRF